MSESNIPVPTRRELRHQADQALLEPPQQLRRRRRIWIWVGSITLLLVLAIALTVWAGQRLYTQAQTAREHLVAALPFAGEAQTALLASDTDASAAATQSFIAEAAQAQAATSGRLWEFASGIPLPLTENLRAVHLVTEIAVRLGDDVLTPASTLDLNALKPVQGRIDLATLQGLSETVDSIDRAVTSSLDSVRELDRSALIEQVDGGVTDIESSLQKLKDVIGPAQGVLSVLPEALGADGPRNYLLMFQGNAEARAGGGGPGSFILIRVENGGLTIANEAAATDFEIALPEPITPLDAETEALYSDTIGRWIANLSATPDFPTSAALAKAWWADRFDDQIDGVISVDPVALSYMLTATGPLPLPTGETLTSENAVALLLNTAYFDYPTGVESNVFFAGASATVFAALTQGSADPVALVNALTRSADEGRIKIWTADANAQELLDTSPTAGVLPRDNEDETTIGVFFNDTTGSKMDYYVDASVTVSTDQCSADGPPTWTTTVAFANSISREDAGGLPLYITGPYYNPGDIATDFIVYAPVGARIESWTLDGNEHPAIAHTTHLGRDAVRISALTPPVTTSTFVVNMVGSDGASADGLGPVAVRHTPMVRATPVTIDAPGCK